MQISSTVTWTQEDLERMLKVELDDQDQAAQARDITVRQRRKKGEKEKAPKTKTCMFDWVVKGGDVFVTAKTMPITKKMSTATSEQVLKKSLALIRVTRRLARGDTIVPSDLPLGVTMDTLESIMAVAAADDADLVEEEATPEEEATDLADLAHQSRKLMKNESRERP